MEKARVIAIGISLDKPAVDPKRHIAVISMTRDKSKLLFIPNRR
jgi:hypothetical protein